MRQFNIVKIGMEMPREQLYERINQRVLNMVEAGLEMEVKEYVQNQYILLVLPMPNAIAAEDNFEITAGCDKTFKSCVSKFNNAINFRGHPHLPGMDRILETAGTRSK